MLDFQAHPLARALSCFLVKADVPGTRAHLTEDIPHEMEGSEEPLWLIRLRAEYDEPKAPCVKRSRRPDPRTHSHDRGTRSTTKRERNKKRKRDTVEATRVYKVLTDSDEKCDEETQTMQQGKKRTRQDSPDRSSWEHGDGDRYRGGWP